MKINKKIILILSIFILFTLAFDDNEEDFDSFNDESSSFVIKSKKPKINISGNSQIEENEMKFKTEKTGKNRAINMTVKNFVIFSKLKDIENRYLVIDLSFENVLKSQKVVVINGSNHPSSWIGKTSNDYTYKEAIPTYSIPDITSHLYLRINNSEERKIDIISILLDNSLMNYDNNEINVFPKKLKRGQVAFKIPKHIKLEQFSLHYYDTGYGNINLPVIGKMKKETMKIASLPKTSWKNMNDNFAVTVTGYDKRNKIGKNTAKKDGIFEILEINIKSKVNAFLQMDPSERFYLKLGDAHLIKLHPITQALPLGLYQSPSLSPGSNNKFRLAFYIPKKLENLSRSLMVELAGKDIVIPIKKGKSGLSKKNLAKASIEGTSLKINASYLYNNKILIDMTFDDKYDNYSTSLHADSFYLHNKAKFPDLNQRKSTKGVYSWYATINKKTLLTLTDSIVLDGNKKRVLIWFDNPFDKKHKKPYYLVSNIFKNLKYKIKKQPAPLPDKFKYFLTKNYEFEFIQNSVTQKLLAKIEKFKSKKAKEEIKVNKIKRENTKLSSLKSKNKFITIPPISPGFYGKEKLKNFKTISQLITGLKSLKWVPSAYDVTTSIYSTEAIFTQKWATEADMFKAVYNMVKKKNIKFGSYELTKKGEKKLKNIAKNIPVKKEIPFIEWKEKGKKYSLVFPFLKPIKEVKNFITNKKYLTSIKNKKVRLTMKLTYTPKVDGTARSGFGFGGGALSGNTSSEKKAVIFDKSWNSDEISNSPIDVFIPSNTVYYYKDKINYDKKHALKEAKVAPKVLEIKITMPNGKLDVYKYHFKKKQELKDLFFTFAFATPDIPKDVIKKMIIKNQELFKNVDRRKIDTFSFLQWGNRVKIYKFISLQTSNEKHLEKVLDVQARRNKNLRAIMTVIEKTPNKKLISSIDLRNVYNDVYGEKKASHSFNIMSGIFNASAEKISIKNSKNISSYWNKKGSGFMLISSNNKKEAIKYMKKNGIKKNIIARLQNSNKIWFYPMKIKKNIGWLEINPKNYQTNSIYENMMYGATETGEMDMLITSITHYFVGFYSGVFISEFLVIDLFLQYYDICYSLKEAKRLANKASCIISLGSSMVISPDIIGTISAGVGCDGEGALSKGIGIAGGIEGNKTKLGKATGGLAGFANGFGDGVNLYFQMMEKEVKCK